MTFEAVLSFCSLRIAKDFSRILYTSKKFDQLHICCFEYKTSAIARYLRVKIYILMFVSFYHLHTVAI